MSNKSIPNSIPPGIHTTLLPGPGLSVSSFLDFPLPNISPNSVTNNIEIIHYLSESSPDPCVDQKLLQNLPLPCRAVLENIYEHLVYINQQKYLSMQYT